jgi:hypothetical protein
MKMGGRTMKQVWRGTNNWGREGNEQRKVRKWQDGRWRRWRNRWEEGEEE